MLLALGIGGGLAIHDSTIDMAIARQNVQPIIAPQSATRERLRACSGSPRQFLFGTEICAITDSHCYQSNS
jgi:hypothetical protein